MATTTTEVALILANPKRRNEVGAEIVVHIREATTATGLLDRCSGELQCVPYEIP